MRHLEDSLQEEWKDIKGYEGLYQVSNIGRVRSIDRITTNIGGRKNLYKGRILRLNMIKVGYLYAHLCKNNKVKAFRVHRLVASAFIQNPNNYPQVNHKDKNKANNIVNNLEWCTASQNQIHSVSLGRNYNITKVQELCKREISVYRNGVFVAHFNSKKECCEKLGLTKDSVYRTLKGEYKQHKGFTFKYETFGRTNTEGLH